LAPVVSALTGDAGLACRITAPLSTSADDILAGRWPSRWAVLARRPEHLGPLLHHPAWQPPSGDHATRLWTDDYSSLFTVLRWRGAARSVE
ncbi:MAG: hypothetical protein AB1671_29000, partial [Thermodesulfobacteriota bacterium]